MTSNMQAISSHCKLTRMKHLSLVLLLITLCALAVPTCGSAGSQFLLQCTNLSQKQLESVNLARGVCGIGCLLTALFLLLLLLLNRAYKSILQRLFIYLTVMTVILEICLSVQIEHYFNYSGQETFCTVLGFISEYIGSVTFTFTNEISIYLFYMVYSRLKGKTPSSTETWSFTRSPEWIMLSIAVIFPLTYTWVPFLDGKYGLNGATCWIKTQDENCTHSGLKDQVVIMSARYLVYGIIVIATVALAIVYCRTVYRYRETETLRKLLRKTLFLSMATVIAITVLTLLSLAYIIVSFEMKHANYGLWLVNAAGIPISMLVVPVIFLIYVRKVNTHTKISCRACCFRNRNSTQSAEKQSPIDHGQLAASEFLLTNPDSTRLSSPSYTHYDNEYTGEFTIISSGAVPKNEECSLIQAQANTGYNAVDRCNPV